MRNVTLLFALAFAAAGCADLTPTQQRAMTGAGMGAAGGAVIGAIGGDPNGFGVTGISPDATISTVAFSTG